MPHRDWVDFLEAFGPLIAVLVALFIGGMQLWLQKRQLKHDLFDKRLEVYQGVQNYVTVLLRDNEESDRFASYRQFRSETDPGEFLFGRDVWAYIKSIGEAGAHFRTAQYEVKSHRVIVNAPIAPINPPRPNWFNEVATKLDQAEQEEAGRRQFLTEAFEGGVKATFNKYLRLKW